MQFSISNGGTTKTLSSLINNSMLLDVETGEIQRRAISGKLYLWQLYNKIHHELPVSNVASADATIINAWKTSGATLTYTPDTNVAGTTYDVLLCNTGLPLQPMGHSVDIYEGRLILREI